MQRGEAGKYESTTIGGEQVRAFVPLPPPPHPALALDGSQQRTLEAATLALGRLDAISTLLPDDAIFLYAYVRKEAVLSSQIEGTQSTLSDLLLFELEEAPRRSSRGRRRGFELCGSSQPWLTSAERGISAQQSADPRNSRSLAISRAGKRQGAGRIPPLPKLDWRHAARRRRIRATAPHRRARLHVRTRTLLLCG